MKIWQSANSFKRTSSRRLVSSNYWNRTCAVNKGCFHFTLQKPGMVIGKLWSNVDALSRSQLNKLTGKRHTSTSLKSRNLIWTLTLVAKQLLANLATCCFRCAQKQAIQRKCAEPKESKLKYQVVWTVQISPVQKDTLKVQFTSHPRADIYAWEEALSQTYGKLGVKVGSTVRSSSSS